MRRCVGTSVCVRACSCFGESNASPEFRTIKSVAATDFHPSGVHVAEPERKETRPSVPSQEGITALPPPVAELPAAPVALPPLRPMMLPGKLLVRHVRMRGDGNGYPYDSLDVTHILPLLRRGEGDGMALDARAARPAYPVDIVLRIVREVVVDHHLDR